MRRFTIKNTFTTDDGDMQETVRFASSATNAIRDILMIQEDWGVDWISEKSQREDFRKHHGIDPYTLEPEAVARIMSGPGLGVFEIMVEEEGEYELPPRTLEEKLLLEDQLTPRFDAGILGMSEEEQKTWIDRVTTRAAIVGESVTSIMSAEQLLDNLGVQSISSFGDDVIIASGPLGTWGGFLDGKAWEEHVRNTTQPNPDDSDDTVNE